MKKKYIDNYFLQSIVIAVIFYLISAFLLSLLFGDGKITKGGMLKAIPAPIISGFLYFFILYLINRNPKK